MNPDAFARLLTDYCLEAQPGPAGDGRHDDARRTAAAGAAARDCSSARRGRSCGRRCRARTRASGARRAERSSTASPAAELAEAEHVDAWLRIQAEVNTNALAGVDPALLSRAARGRAPLREFVLTRRWAITLWPTTAAAQQAAMGTADFEDFVERALFLDRDDPVAAWGELHDFQAKLIERLAPVREIRIEAPGTDLTLNVEGRTWINSDGKRNMPSGEVFTGPHEDSAEGHIRFTIPTSPRGVVVEDVTLEFREGRVVSARAERGDGYLQATLDTDGGAGILGELGIGTNFGIDRSIGAILFDEKIGGTVHLALGKSYPETGGTNESVVHWDLICDLRQGGRLSADGDTILEDGQFLS